MNHTARNLYFYAGAGAYAWIVAPAERVVPFCLGLQRTRNRLCVRDAGLARPVDEGSHPLRGFAVAIAYPQCVHPVAATVNVDRAVFWLAAPIAKNLALRTPCFAVEPWLDAVLEGQTCFLSDAVPPHIAARAARILHRMYDPGSIDRMAA